MTSSDFLDSEQKSYLELQQDDENKVNLLIDKVKHMEIPDLFEGGMGELEEKAILANVKYNKSNLSIRKGVGQECKCGHGKFKHVHDESSYYKTGHCTLKTCKCSWFRMKRQYW